MYRTLTVRETIKYAALLRLSSGIPKKRKLAYVDKVISELGLEVCADTIIGDENTRGISGGERKRLAIGVETVTRPALLFLDEPTSGLDAFTAYSLIESLHKTTRSLSRSVILSIHQPRGDIFSLFDKLLLLSQGRVIYWGPSSDVIAYFSSLGYECPMYMNPADFALDTVTVDFRSPSAKESSTKRIYHILDEWESRFDTSTVEKIVESNHRQYPKLVAKRMGNSWIAEFLILTSRSFKDANRNYLVMISGVFQTLFIFLLICFTFFQLDYSQSSITSRLGVLFFLTANLLFSTIMPVIIIFVLERAIVIRERYSSSYYISSYYFAKAFSILPFRLAMVSIFSLGIYYIIGLNPLASCYFIFWGIFLDLSFAAQALSLLIGAAVPDVQVAQAAAPAVIVVFFIYGGYFANLANVSWILRWIEYISIIRYGFMALVQNEFSTLVFECSNGSYAPPGEDCQGGFSTGQQIIAYFNMNQFSISTCCLIILGIGCVFHLLGYLMLRSTTKPSLRLI